MNHILQNAPKYLLIDDDKSFRSIVCRTAENSGILFHGVASLSELKNIKTVDTYEAVFVDYDLGNLTGFQIAELLNVTLKDKPVVLISSTNRPYQDKLSQLPNLVGFVSKWSNPHEFLNQAMQVLRERPGISA
ncbi:MAG: response regulator [Proteobacteria bacterium]|nr:response regulator [Pseudomonadota bacterium]